MSKSTNRLISEKSPYLLQHATNPVDWYPWGEGAFEKALKEDKPVFLSIGYSTCHWCHVMARESFEDSEIAEILNRHFISIKVDREERPDVDNVYMQVCQALTGSGGWPLTIIMSPEKKPFFAGTYFPKERKWGRPGLKEILLGVSSLWKKDRDKVLKTSAEIIDHIARQKPKETYSLGKEAVTETFHLLEKSYDREFGGFGTSPKFPTPHFYTFLLRYYYRTNSQIALDVVRRSLLAMRLGGIFDHLGFGFHRYSTDRMFLLPHFEKMLYDQANLLQVYLEAFQVMKEDLFGETVKEIISYLKREMFSPEGAFYSAESAESEGEEGKFYTFSYEEVFDILEKSRAETISKLFNLRKEGNYREEATGQPSGENIFHLTEKIPKELKAQVKKSLKELFLYREKRVKPDKDDKIITAWNGLMISSLAKAGGVFPRINSLKMAEQAARFVKESLYVKRRLLRRYRKGEAKIKGYLDDYAFYVLGLISLFQAVQKREYLEFALALTREMIELFWDERDDGFFLNGRDSEKMIFDYKESYDGAFSSSNTIAAQNLLKLSRITQDSEMNHYAQKQFRFMSRFAADNLMALAGFMSFFDDSLSPPREIVLVKDKGRKFLATLNRLYLPDTVYLYPNSLLTWTENYQKAAKEPSVFICENFSCKKPLHDAEELKRVLVKKD
jgi:uncharacterized protein YyaL (SSP411 family)